MVKNGAPGNPGEENNSYSTKPVSHMSDLAFHTDAHSHTHLSSWFKENREGSRKVHTRERMMSSR